MPRKVARRGRVCVVARRSRDGSERECPDPTNPLGSFECRLLRARELEGDLARRLQELVLDSVASAPEIILSICQGAAECATSHTMGEFREGCWRFSQDSRFDMCTGSPGSQASQSNASLLEGRVFIEEHAQLEFIMSALYAFVLSHRRSPLVFCVGSSVVAYYCYYYYYYYHYHYHYHYHYYYYYYYDYYYYSTY